MTWGCRGAGRSEGGRGSMVGLWHPGAVDAEGCHSSAAVAQPAGDGAEVNAGGDQLGRRYFVTGLTPAYTFTLIEPLGSVLTLPRLRRAAFEGGATELTLPGSHHWLHGRRVEGRARL